MPCSHQELTRERRLTPSILLLPLSPQCSVPLVQHSHLPLLPVRGKPWPRGAQICPSRDTPERPSPEPPSLNTRIIFFAGGAHLFSVPEAPGTRCPRGRKTDKERRRGEKPRPSARSSGRNPGHLRTPRWNLGSSCGAATERARTPTPGTPSQVGAAGFAPASPSRGFFSPSFPSSH